MTSIEALHLPVGIRARTIDRINGLQMHVLEAGFETSDRPALLLLHGFPELAYSWRKVMLPLAAAGYHVIAPDQRGYGRTLGWDDRYDADLAPFRMTNLVRDALGVLYACGHQTAAAVVGHDFGSSVAAWCALIRPDVFGSVVMMSAPFGGPPSVALGGPPSMALGGPPSATLNETPPIDPIHAALAALPRPRKHYHQYYSTRAANADMLHAPQGLHAFLRAYYHMKSADWIDNQPHPLHEWSASALAQLPDYYVMDLHHTMPQAVAAAMPNAAQIASCAWLPEPELAVYTAEFARTGFQGGLDWYRCRTSGKFEAEYQTWANAKIQPPACFISGASDWGPQQKPLELARMQTQACRQMHGIQSIAGAGHWVQQERPAQTVQALLDFFLDAKVMP